MKIPLLIASIGLMTTLNIHNAAAFSTDQGSNVSAEGSSNYVDPDEQMPRFMVAPGAAMTGNQSLSVGASPVTLPVAGENDDGARAFDQAFSRQQDKE